MSSSFLSSGNAPAQRVPAWKRLGLQLKATSEDRGQQSSTPHPSYTSTTASASGVPNAKRKSFGAPALEQSAKRAKQDNSQDRFSAQTSKKAKSVSFTREATGTRPPARENGAHVTNKQSKPTTKKAAAPPAKSIRQAPVNLEPALTYLRLWHTSRDTWKFNKNHQTKLLEQVFADETTIPAADISVFYEYISGLKGAVRTRLKELANGIKAQDMEQGSDGFPTAKEVSKEAAEKKQAEYEAVVQTFLGRDRTPDKRRFDEVEYVLRTTDMEMQRRVVKRMRAEVVLDELPDTEDANVAAERGENSSGSAQNASSQAATNGGAEGDKRLKLNDGSQQKVKRKRKLRTAAVEDDTSSESESESESDSESDTSDSSSSSDSEDDGGEGENNAGPARNGAGADDSSSSFSSSSESDSEDSDSDSEEEDGNEA